MENTSRRRRSLILAIFLVALLIRLLFNFAFLGINYDTIHSAFLVADDVSYVRAGELLKHDFEYKVFLRPPLYPAFLAMSFTLFGDDSLPVRILQSIIGALTCVLIYLIAESLYGSKTGYVAACIAIFFLPLFVLNGLLLTETLFTFLSTLVILLFIKYCKKQNGKWIILCGICMGLAALTRSEYLLTIVLILFLMIPILLRHHQITLKHALALLITIILMLTPWITYASLQQHAFVPISTMGGTVFIGANNPQVDKQRTGSWVPPDMTGLLDENDKQELLSKNTAAQSSILYKKSLDWLVANPEKIPELVFWKEKAFLLSSHYYATPVGRYHYFRFAQDIPYLVLLLLACFGLGLIYQLERIGLRKRFPLFYVYIFSGILTTAIYWGNIRFKNYLDPVLIIFASVAIVTIFSGVRTRGHEVAGF